MAGRILTRVTTLADGVHGGQAMVCVLSQVTLILNALGETNSKMKLRQHTRERCSMNAKHTAEETDTGVLHPR